MRIAARKEGPIKANLQFGPAIRDPGRGIGGAFNETCYNRHHSEDGSMGRPRDEINALTRHGRQK
jgi:hypothetical protein